MTGNPAVLDSSRTGGFASPPRSGFAFRFQVPHFERDKHYVDEYRRQNANACQYACFDVRNGRWFTLNARGEFDVMHAIEFAESKESFCFFSAISLFFEWFHSACDRVQLSNGLTHCVKCVGVQLMCSGRER